MSIDSPIAFEYPSRPAADWQRLAKIHSCTVTPLFHFAPFGQLKDGSSLDISGPTFEMTLSYDPLQGATGYILSGRRCPNFFYPDVEMLDCTCRQVYCLILF